MACVQQVRQHQTTKPHCRVYHIGLSPAEATEVEGFFGTFAELVARFAFGPAKPGDDVDLLIVNGDDAVSLQLLEQVRRRRPELLSIIASGDERDFGGQRVIRKPITFRNLVAILDSMTSTDLSRLRSPAGDGAMRVLVVDDSLPARQFMRIKLEQLGVTAALPMQVDVVDVGDKALQAIEASAYDLVFLDVVMPGMDGYEVCRRMKQLKPVRVVMLTGCTTSVDFSRGRSAGCDNYLAKPAEDADLLTILRLTALRKQIAGSRLGI